MAQIVGFNSPKNLHKIKLVSNSDIFQIKISKSELFFNLNVNKESDLYTKMQKEGVKLNIKKDFDIY